MRASYLFTTSAALGLLSRTTLAEEVKLPAPVLEWLLERVSASSRRAASSWLLLRLLMGGDVKILAMK